MWRRGSLRAHGKLCAEYWTGIELDEEIKLSGRIPRYYNFCIYQYWHWFFSAAIALSQHITTEVSLRSETWLPVRRLLKTPIRAFSAARRAAALQPECAPNPVNAALSKCSASLSISEQGLNQAHTGVQQKGGFMQARFTAFLCFFLDNEKTVEFYERLWDSRVDRVKGTRRTVLGPTRFYCDWSRFCYRRFHRF